MVPRWIALVGLSLTRDKLVMTMTEESGNIWVLDNVQNNSAWFLKQHVRQLSLLASSRQPELGIGSNRCKENPSAW
jgi:hypothetical protein